MEALYKTRFDSPLGPMIAVAGINGLCALEFFDPGRLSGIGEQAAATIFGIHSCGQDPIWYSRNPANG